MRDLSKLLWCELSTDEERVFYLQKGFAVNTGIVAQSIVNDLIDVFEFRLRALMEKIV